MKFQPTILKKFKTLPKKFIIIAKNFYRPRLIVIIASAHKVGSTWLFNMVKELGDFQSQSLSPEFLETGTLVLDNPHVWPELVGDKGWLIYKSHSFPINYKLPELIAQKVKFITIIRDPRDVIVSASFYLAKLPVELGGWGDSFQLLNEQERIIQLIQEGDFLLNRLEAWYHAQDTYVARYENLINAPEKELSYICDYLNIKIHESKITKAINKYSFKKLTNRNNGQEKRDDFLRKGITGDWKNYFDQNCIEAFKTAQNGTWNHLLVAMGYEKIRDW